MNKIKEAFENKKAFIPFITGGDPSLETMKKLLLALQEAGADLIEIGIPFSDPIAEGPIIQEADERALLAGCTTDRLFDAIRDMQDQIHIPLVFMTYINAIYTYGKERFMKRCVECRIAGVSVPDMPFEEKEELSGVCRKYGVKLVSFVAPTSNDRIQKIAKEAEGFLYCVSPLGVIGVRDEATAEIKKMMKKVREATDTPCVVRFGITTPKQARLAATVSDGAIVDSAIVKIIAEHGEECVPYVAEYVRGIKEAVISA